MFHGLTCFASPFEGKLLLCQARTYSVFSSFITDIDHMSTKVTNVYV
jgi:hypothetical protein